MMTNSSRLTAAWCSTTGPSANGHHESSHVRPAADADGGDAQKYLQAELAAISQSIKTIIAEIVSIKTILAAHGLS
jgi:hypothetical protein